MDRFESDRTPTARLLAVFRVQPELAHGWLIAPFCTLVMIPFANVFAAGFNQPIILHAAVITWITVSSIATLQLVRDAHHRKREHADWQPRILLYLIAGSILTTILTGLATVYLAPHSPGNIPLIITLAITCSSTAAGPLYGISLTDHQQTTTDEEI